MKISHFTQLLAQPNKVASPVELNQLEDILKEYPYFQTARALHLKGLKNLNSFKYGKALKCTAAYTTDRTILFKLINTPIFDQDGIANTISERHVPLLEKNVVAEVVDSTKSVKGIIESNMPREEIALPRDSKEANQILDPALFSSKKKNPAKKKDKNKIIAVETTKKEERKKEITKTNKQKEAKNSFDKDKSTKHSFSQWLNISDQNEASNNKINQKEGITEEKVTKKKKEKQLPASKEKKFELIDKFIEKSPKIVPKEPENKVNIKESSKIDQNELMTATLAKVYLDQKRYKKAIQAYKILSLKYPEKSSFFATRIKEARILQQNKE